MANLPSPIVGAGGGGGRSTGESLILALASAAPGMLMQFLQQRQQSADITAQGDASASVIGELARTGVLSPEFAQAAGARVTPGQAGPMLAPGGQQILQGELGASIQTPEIRGPGTNTTVDTSGVNRRAAPQLLAQMLGAQQQVAGIEASKAQTAAATTQTKLATEAATRDAELHSFRVQQLQESIITEQASRKYQELMGSLRTREVASGERRDTAAIAQGAASIRQGDERIRLERQQALQGTQEMLVAMHSDQMRNFTNLSQLLDNTKAASGLVFGTIDPPKADEFVERHFEAASAGILTGQSTSPFLAIQKAVFGDRPDVEFASRIGMEVNNVALINQSLTRNNGDATATYAELRETLRAQFPDNKDAVDAELAKAAIYLPYKTGTKLTLPPEERRGLRARMEQMLSIGKSMQPDFVGR